MPVVKTPVTVRIAPDLLQQVRQGAARDNRSVTNFIETALREHLAGGNGARSRPLAWRRTETENKRTEEQKNNE